MIDIIDAEFGQKFYIVWKTLGTFKLKETFIDEQGRTWVLQEKRTNYRIDEYTFCGKVEILIHGEVDLDYYDSLVEYYFKKEGLERPILLNDLPNYEYWFHTREEAEEYGKSLSNG